MIGGVMDIQTYAPSSPGMIYCSGGTGPYVLKTDHLAALEAETIEKRGRIVALEIELRARLLRNTRLKKQIAALTARAESLDRIITEDTEREIALM